MNQCTRRVVLVVAVLVANSASARGDDMTEQLLRRVRQQDTEVVEAMKTVGPEIVPSLVRLARHGDRDVRELALYCLEQKGGQQARVAFVKALYDKDLQIRAIAASSFLQRHYGPENLSALLKVLRRHRDGLVREHVALVIGKIGQPRVVAALKRIRRAEKNRLVRNNIRLALARLGDKPSQKSILNGIRAEKIKVRLKAVRDFGYMNDRRLVVHLLPLLEDRRNAVNVAPSGHKAYVRMCDVAVEVLDAILDHPFSFQVGSIGRVRSYSSKEIAEARSLIGREIGVQ